MRAPRRSRKRQTTSAERPRRPPGMRWPRSVAAARCRRGGFVPMRCAGVGAPAGKYTRAHMNQTPSAFVLIAIALATLATGIGSVWLAALLMRLGLGGRHGSVGAPPLPNPAGGGLP